MTNNPDSFIDEVSEELRRERSARLLRRWGWVAVLAVLLIVGGAAWNEWRKARATDAAQTFGDALFAAQGDPAALAALPTSGPGQAAVAALSRAAALADAGARAAAVEVLAALAADPEIDALYRDLARLRAAALDPDWTGATGARTVLLDELAAPGAPFRPLALEQRALDQVGSGDMAGARATLDRLVQEPALPPSLGQRVAQMRAALGDGGAAE